MPVASAGDDDELHLTRSGISLDPGRCAASRDGRALALTARELAVLRLLLEAQGRVVSAENLLDQVWDGPAGRGTSTVRTTIVALRRKLGPPPVVETIVRSGYRIT